MKNFRIYDVNIESVQFLGFNACMYTELLRVFPSLIFAHFDRSHAEFLSSKIRPYPRINQINIYNRCDRNIIG